MCWFFVTPLFREKINPSNLSAPSFNSRHLNKPSDLISVLDSIKSASNHPSDDAKKILDQHALDQLKQKREENVKYGGADIDPEHLGGFVTNDSDTYERELWEWFIDLFNVSSILDVGCGMGYSTAFFKNHLQHKWRGQENVLCVEGSKDAVDQSLVPSLTVHHDYTKGPWWPDQTFDMVWSAEFLEHVDEEYMINYMSTFKKAKFILVTHSIWGGWHHSCVHESPWWIAHFEAFGFQYQTKLTEMARDHCPMVKNRLKYSYHKVTPEGHRGMSHFHFHGLIFVNRLFLHRLTPFDEAFFQKIGQQISIW